MLIRKFLATIGVPTYLAAIIDSYLKEQTLRYNTNDGPKEYVVSASVPQGSVLGPLLWNNMYNDVLNLPVPEEATVLGYPDDIALLVAAKHLEDAELYSSEAYSVVKASLESAGLGLVEEKTEAILINEYSSRKDDAGRRRTAAYLQAAYSQGGGLSCYMQSQFGETRGRKNGLKGSVFRAASDDAAFVISAMMPIDILATEMMNIYDPRSISPLSEVEKAERERSISKWQQQ